MSNKKYTLLIISVFTLIAATSFTACQSGPTSERPLNTNDRRQPTTTPAEEVFPTLKLSQKNPADASAPAVNSDFQLRSQIAHYTNAANSALEIILTDSRSGSCKNQAPELQAGESIIKITVKSKNGKALAAGDYNADQYELAATVSTKSADGNQESKFDANQIPTFKVTDLNKSIFRGSFKADSANQAIEGEFFTAICK